MPVTEQLRIADLPSATIPPRDATTRRQVRRTRARLGRREFIRVAAGAAVGTGLAFASLFPTARQAQAHTQAYTSWPPDSSNCIGSPYAGSTGCCSCGSAVSSIYCASNGWHRHHSVQQGGGTAERQHRPRLTSCNGRNGWRWRRSGNIWRCSDGQARVCTASCTPWSNTVCPRQV